MNEAHERLKNIGNTIGAHVNRGSIQNALERMPLDQEGFLEFGRKLKATHYKFATELVVEIMLEKRWQCGPAVKALKATSADSESSWEVLALIRQDCLLVYGGSAPALMTSALKKR